MLQKMVINKIVSLLAKQFKLHNIMKMCGIVQTGRFYMCQGESV